VRVYIPATLTMLQSLVADGSIHARSGTAFAVTPTLRESYFQGDDDELAEVALREAALASLRLLAAEGEIPGVPPRRAVLVADVDGATARPDVIAAYLDNAAAESAVLAAIDVIDSADLGDEDAEFTVGDAQDHDLAWYATQELPFLLDLL
jgi:hypothetical protein